MSRPLRYLGLLMSLPLLIIPTDTHGCTPGGAAEAHLRFAEHAARRLVGRQAKLSSVCTLGALATTLVRSTRMLHDTLTTHAVSESRIVRRPTGGSGD
ncbi:hypothetical protein FB45DRAFT_937875 [Roridomyces roridus]|uniref:Uncharacterized protein n=1 Tax=Roridomyces roridus TaxID=1738132 RepID=A0AAD7B9N3_9AGAR|nr:hypothetical protein FB45DRAFT_937875 [Roridomyces roridus]